MYETKEKVLWHIPVVTLHQDCQLALNESVLMMI